MQFNSYIETLTCRSTNQCSQNKLATCTLVPSVLVKMTSLSEIIRCIVMYIEHDPWLNTVCESKSKTKYARLRIDPWSDAIDYSIKRVEEYDCLVYKHIEEATYGMELFRSSNFKPTFESLPNQHKNGMQAEI